MNIKIQGGGSGTYANTGSCTGVTTYLQHEDLERMKNGQEVQPFFNNSRDYISAQEVTFKIDNNKAKLSRNDAKFYVITVSPSSRELEKMGKTEKEQAEAMRKYVRDDVMQHYAEGFGKGLNKEDIEYYGKIHFERKGADRYDMHAHIIVSRKDRSNTRKLSPKTNHTGKKNCGNVKGGFDRTDFFRKCETSFDKRTGYVFVELKRRLWQAHCGNAWDMAAGFGRHFYLPKKRGTLAPMYFLISSQTEILIQQ